MSISLALIIFTAVMSYQALGSRLFLGKTLFIPHIMQEQKEWYRFLSHGFIHKDWMHFGINMFVLYQFGHAFVEPSVFGIFDPQFGNIIYLGFYISAIVFSSIFSFFRHRNNPSYSALGASGAVSAVVFVMIMVEPWAKLGFLFLPGIEFPAILLGVLYLAYSFYMAERNRDNVGHDAHISGAFYGIIFMLIYQPHLGSHFIQTIQNPPF